MSRNDIPEFDYASHSMSMGRKIFLIFIGLVYALGFGALWYALLTGGMSGLLIGFVGACVTVMAVLFGILSPLKRRKR